MPIWKPPGNVVPSPAKWEANPDRATFFLHSLIDARNSGKFNTSPTVSTFNDISKLLWVRYAVYHTPKQLKNYYGNRKAFWANICWARDRTGIGWDDSEKKIIASNEWWHENEGRKGLIALKDRTIEDYDLLDTLFAGQRAIADHCYGPFQPIPLNSDEGSGDSDNPEGNRFFDPQPHTSQGETSMNVSSGSKRATDSSACPPGKKKKKGKNKDEQYSPYSARMARRFNVFLDVKESRRRMEFESEGTTKSTSQIPSGSTINSRTNMDRCMVVLTDVLKIDQNSDMFYHSVDLLVENPDWQAVFLGYTDLNAQLKWLQRKIRTLFPGVDAGTSPHLEYDLNQPPCHTFL